MPKIRTYEQQVGIPNAELRSSASPETASLPGQAMANLGGQVADFAQVMHQNEVRDDIGSSQEKLAEIRNKYSQRVMVETQRGNIDTEKLYNDYNEEINSVSGEFKTNKGKEYFTKQSLSLGSQLIKSAAISQSQVKGKLAVEQWHNSMNLNANTLTKSPADFESVLSSSIDAINANVENGSMAATEAEKLKRLSGETFAASAVTGWASISADTAKDLLDQGQYDKYLDPTKKQELYKSIKAYKRGEETDSIRVRRLEKEKLEKVSEAWQQDNLDNLNDKTITSKQILESPMKSEKKIQWLNMLKKNLSETLKTDPAVKNNAIQRVLLPDGDPQKVDNISELYEFVGKGLTITDIKQISSFMDSTPEGKALKDSRKMLTDAAKAQILKTDPFSRTTIGHQNLSKFSNDLLDRETQLKKEGKDVKELYNPNSKEYFGHQINKYKLQAADIVGSFNAQFDTSISSPELQSTKRKPGESINDYLKRTGGP
jgi:hypothetical protein